MQTVTIRKDFIIKHVVFFFILIMAVVSVFMVRGAKPEISEVKIYFVDAEMMRLIPVKTSIPQTNTRNMAQRILDELIEGRDDNPKIRRIIPKEKRCMTVRLVNDVAYVDLKKALVENHPAGRDLELLTVYSVVNSLTGLDGIRCVRFTVDGKKEKNFMGYLNMEETFVPDYFV